LSGKAQAKKARVASAIEVLSTVTTRTRAEIDVQKPPEKAAGYRAQIGGGRRLEPMRANSRQNENRRSEQMIPIRLAQKALRTPRHTGAWRG
jgi:hypothetical protein